nr:ribonuclease H-like domain-containing protein [Tanacetum cinerariifolium]
KATFFYFLFAPRGNVTLFAWDMIALRHAHAVLICKWRGYDCCLEAVRGISDLLGVGFVDLEDLITSLDLGNPLYLQNSGLSSNTIISVKLTGTESYRVKDAAMKLPFNIRNNTGFIDERNLIEALPFPLVVLYLNLRKVGHTIDRCFDLIGYPPGYDKNLVLKQNGFKSSNANFAFTSNENGTSLSFTNEHMMRLMNLINEVPSRNMQANMAGNGYHQKDKIQAKPDKTEHEIKSVEKSKVNQKSTQSKSKTKPRLKNC